MAHFYGDVSGKAKTPASRLGTKSSGLSTVAASWAGSVRVWLHYDEDKDLDLVSIWLEPWHGSGVSALLYRGPVGELDLDGIGSDIKKGIKSHVD